MVFWYFQRVEQGCIWNEWVKNAFYKVKPSLSDCNSTRIHNHLVHEGTTSLAKWLSVRLWTKLSGCGFESICNHLQCRFRACFEQGVPWHSDNYRVRIHSETRMWHDKDIQLKPSAQHVLLLHHILCMLFQERY